MWYIDSDSTKIYLFYNTFGNNTTYVYTYTPSTDTVTTLINNSTSFLNMYSVSVYNNKIYFLGGQNTQSPTTGYVKVYDISTGSTTQKISLRINSNSNSSLGKV